MVRDVVLVHLTELAVCFRFVRFYPPPESLSTKILPRFQVSFRRRYQ
jgi:hypothetical protein